MNSIQANIRHWALLLLLMGWAQVGLAQTELFEMVVEKTDGTELAFLMTDDYPLLQYSYRGEDVPSVLEIQTENRITKVLCKEVKRLYTRVATGIVSVLASGRPFDVYTLTGQMVHQQVTTLKGLPRGIYVVDGHKVVVK